MPVAHLPVSVLRAVFVVLSLPVILGACKPEAKPLEHSALHDALTAALTQVYDPEFGVSIHDLGLIHDCTLDATGAVQITMTLTSRYCPAGEVILDGVKSVAEAVPGVNSVEVILTWDPAWTPDRLTPAAREQLGW